VGGAWYEAAAAGLLTLVLGAGLVVWAVRNMHASRGVYVVARGGLYVYLAAGLLMGHWAPMAGITAIAVFVIGLGATSWARNHRPRRPYPYD
jgi:hypothetical protein